MSDSSTGFDVIQYDREKFGLMSLDILIMEFDRGNFTHVNDTTEFHVWSMDLCASVVNHLVRIKELEEK